MNHQPPPNTNGPSHPSSSVLHSNHGHWLAIHWPEQMKPDTVETLNRFVAELVEAVHEVGPQQALSDLQQKPTPGLFGGSSQHPQITIIPGPKKQMACTPIVVTVGSGTGPSLPRPGRAPRGLRGVCRVLRSHLIACFGITEAAVLVTDVWDPNLIRESLDDFRAHKRRGVLFTVLLVHDGGVASVSAGL